MISILVTGISGRMGQAIQEAVTQNPDTCVGSTHDQGQELYPALAKCDVAIDFSHHAFTSTLLAEAVANNKPLVIGTTGHTELERQDIVDAAASIPIVFASNYSVLPGHWRKSCPAPLTGIMKIVWFLAVKGW